jgi:hypothetical protein
MIVEMATQPYFYLVSFRTLSTQVTVAHEKTFVVAKALACNLKRNTENGMKSVIQVFFTFDFTAIYRFNHTLSSLDRSCKPVFQ